jgi:hypothetical protein
MKKAFLRLCIVLMFIPSVLSLAQEATPDAPAYRLRQPSAEEYLQTIEAPLTEELQYWRRETLVGDLSRVLMTRFPMLYQEGFGRLLEAYNTLNVGRFTFVDRGDWARLLLQAWLRDNQIDLNDARRLRFADFSATVTPRDFNGDGVLDLTKGEASDRRQCRYEAEILYYLVVQQQSVGEITFIDTPLFWHGRREYPYDKGGVIELAFEDLNADGLPEWVLNKGGVTLGGPAMGHAHMGHLVVLGWREGRLVDLTQIDEILHSTDFAEDAGACHGPIPRDVTWEFANVDEDSAIEILQAQTYEDNWFCTSRRTRTIDWDAAADRYVFQNETLDFPQDTRQCAYRLAEEAMWQKNYAEALSHYERAAQLPSIDFEDMFWVEPQQIEDLQDYHLSRMALAYILTEQPDRVEAALSQLESVSNETLQQFVGALRVNVQNPFGACLAAFDMATRGYPPNNVGVTVEMKYNSYPEYRPEYVGCDIEPMIADVVNAQPYTGASTPVGYLEGLGIRVREHLQADLNGDDRTEWLVWPEYLLQPFFFAINDVGEWATSRSDINTYEQAKSIQRWTLPNEAGTSLIQFTELNIVLPPWRCRYDSICGFGGWQERCVEGEFSFLTMWRMTGQTLQPVFGSTVCTEDLSRLFPQGQPSLTLDAGAVSVEDYEPIIQERVFTWDDEAGTYLLPLPPSTPTPSSTISQPEPPRYRRILDALEAGDYAYVVENSSPTLIVEESYFADFYYRALALEALGREDEALAAYVALYQAAPDSPWGLLAVLHVE